MGVDSQQPPDFPQCRCVYCQQTKWACKENRLFGCECDTFSILDLLSLRHPSLHNCTLKDMALEGL